MTAILGISAFYHDSAAALVIDGRVVAAAQEERFTRKKHDEGFPIHAIDYCLEAAGCTADQLDYVGFYDKPLLKFDRLLETYLSYAPRGFSSFLSAMPVWLRQKLYLPREMSRGLKNQYRRKYVFTSHHESHAASAFFPSPFTEAAILTLDGVGEWSTASWGCGRGNRIELTHEMRFPHSLGLLYSAFTYYTGFEVNSGEYKLMGLAPYGEPRYVNLILEKLIDLKPDGSFRMDMSYFNYCQGLTMTSPDFHSLFGGPPRQRDEAVTQRDMDIAASIQHVTEEIMLRSARHVHKETGLKNLCLAGGVALNCVGNGRILRDGPFEHIWIQPAAGDAGGALGTALFIWHQLLGQQRIPEATDTQSGSLLGPDYDDHEIASVLDAAGGTYTRIQDDDLLCDRVAEAISQGKVVGWFQGRMEFGPRALGARSIIGDARDPKMQSIINLKVKFREGFRPFAPAVLQEHAHSYFEVPQDIDSPYMLLVAPVKDERRRPLTAEEARATGIAKLHACRSEVPAITHVDFSARIQTVDEARHGLYWRLIDSFYRRTGCPVVVNTSFNLGWDPIVCTPKEAFDTFMASDIDLLCMGHYVLEKTQQPAWVSVEERSVLDPVLEELWCSPCHRAALVLSPGRLLCTECGTAFTFQDGIPQLAWPTAAEGTDDVQPSHLSIFEPADDDSVRSLIDRSRRHPYAGLLNAAIPYNSTVLEIGCATGQLSNLLGVSCRRVVGTDPSLNALRRANSFAREQGLSRVRFVQMNPSHRCFRTEQFDVVLCNDALAQTENRLEHFQQLLSLVKPGGHVILGLPKAQARPGGTIDGMLAWFDQCGVDFVRGIPKVTLAGAPPTNQNVFNASSRGTRVDHFWVQLEQMLDRRQRPDVFLMIGQKPQTHADAAVDTRIEKRLAVSWR